jgi:hypothetical protein
MKKETQMKIVEGAINGVVNALFGKLNDGPNFDLLENYKTENFFKGTEGFLKAPLENAKWQLGYANVDLTPKDYKEKNYYMGGYISPDNKFKNLIENVVDKMQGRAIAISDNSGRGISLFCTVDCIGITNGDIREIRAIFTEEFKKRYPDKALASVNVCSTHTHSCVDTEGLWTDFPGKILRNRKKNLKKNFDLEQGTDKEYMNFLRKAISDTFFTAIENMCDGELYFAQKNIGEDYFRNTNRPSATGLVTDVTRFRFVPDDKTRKETLIVNFPAHPDVAGLPTSDGNGTGRELSGDYVYYMGETINKAGFNFMFFNGAICAIYSDRGKALDGHTFAHRYEQSIRYGVEVGKITLALTKSLEEIKNDSLLYDEEEIKKDKEKSKANNAEYTLWCENWEPVAETKIEPIFNIRLREVNVPVTSTLMVGVGKLNIANYKMLKDKDGKYSMFTEIGYIEIGSDIKVSMVPGEFCADLLTGGASLKAEGAVTKTDFNYPTVRELFGEDTIAFGLSNDEIGYIVPDNDFTMGDPGSHYHELVSLGQFVGSSIMKGFVEIKKELQ